MIAYGIGKNYFGIANLFSNEELQEQENSNENTKKHISVAFPLLIFLVQLAGGIYKLIFPVPYPY